MDEKGRIPTPPTTSTVLRGVSAEEKGKNTVPDKLNNYPTNSDFDTSPYAELKRLMMQKGLLNKQPVYYTCKLLFTLGLLVLGLAFLLVVNSFWLQLLDTVYLAFVFAQIGLIGHDAGHRQIFRKVWKNDIVGLIDNLVLGVSYSWWIGKHNRHHSHPNQVGFDPDIDLPLFSFTEEQAQSRQKIARFVTKYQAYLYIPMSTLIVIGYRFISFRFVLQKKGKYPLIEGFLLITSLLLYFGLLLTRMGIWQAILFFTIHHMLLGLFIGTIFAPNHKGMLVLDKESQMNFLHRQVLTSRDIKGGPFTDFWYGGLNYQIEHHLFPNMARNKLREAQQIVKAFCRARSIPYYESSVLQSNKEIHRYMHRIGAPLRGRKPELEGQS